MSGVGDFLESWRYFLKLQIWSKRSSLKQDILSVPENPVWSRISLWSRKFRLGGISFFEPVNYIFESCGLMHGGIGGMP